METQPRPGGAFFGHYEELKAQLELFLRRQQRRARQRLGEETIRRVLANKDDEAAN
jgi:hypothetical protein